MGEAGGGDVLGIGEIIECFQEDGKTLEDIKIG